MRKRFKTASIWVFGVLCILAGVAAGFVPLVPGVVLVFVGLYMISFRSIWLKARLDRVRTRFPKFNAAVLKFETWNAVFLEKLEKIWTLIIGFLVALFATIKDKAVPARFKTRFKK